MGMMWIVLTGSWVWQDTRVGNMIFVNVSSRMKEYISCFSFLFFSSRRRRTIYCRDWSSDVCSSDLLGQGDADGSDVGHAGVSGEGSVQVCHGPAPGRRVLRWIETRRTRECRPDRGRVGPWPASHRSEERRGGDERRPWWAPDH